MYFILASSAEAGEEFRIPVESASAEGGAKEALLGDGAKEAVVLLGDGQDDQIDCCTHSVLLKSIFTAIFLMLVGP